MELRQLTYFKAIVEQGSINAAARSLHMSQPPLSYAIAQLEEELGVQLLVRSAKGIELTHAGNVFYQHANDILNRSSSAMREVSMIGEKQIFRIGITPTVVPVIAPALAKLEKEKGGLALEIHEGSTYRIKELLDDNTLDAAFIRTPVNLQGYKFLTIMEEPMAAVSKTKRSAKTTTLAQLQQEPLILYRRYEPLIQDTFNKYDLETNIVCECDDARTAISLVKEGLGTAIVPMNIGKLQKELSVTMLKEKELTTSILFVWRVSAPSVASLIKILGK